MLSEYFTDELRQVYKNRLMYVVSHTPKRDIAQYGRFYADAYKTSEEIGERTSVPGIVVRRALSAVSPRCPWEASIPGVEGLILDPSHKFPTTDKHKAKALAMIQDWSLHLFNPGSPKTMHFFLNMDQPKKHTGVTIDRHAVKLLGLPFTPNGKGPDSRLSKAQYYWIAAIYEEVAAELGMLVHKVQAFTWYQQRNGLVPDWSALQGCLS